MDHLTKDLNAALTLVPDAASDKREAWRLSLVIAALSNLMSHDTDPVLRAACRARYLDLTDGKPMTWPRS